LTQAWGCGRGGVAGETAVERAMKVRVTIEYEDDEAAETIEEARKEWVDGDVGIYDIINPYSLNGTIKVEFLADDGTVIAQA
jgi:hypothetical protein